MKCRQRDAVYLNYIFISKKKPPGSVGKMKLEHVHACRWDDEDICCDLLKTISTLFKQCTRDKPICSIVRSVSSHNHVEVSFVLICGRRMR